jgi:hypothetical protein
VSPAGAPRPSAGTPETVQLKRKRDEVGAAVVAAPADQGNALASSGEVSPPADAEVASPVGRADEAAAAASPVGSDVAEVCSCTYHHVVWDMYSPEAVRAAVAGTV